MITGFDYGTSNCAMGVISPDSDDGVVLLPLEQNKAFMPSALYALDRELIVEQVGRRIKNADVKEAFITSRAAALGRARRVRHEEGFAPDEQTLFVGNEAISQYLDWPGEGYYVKSPKSFLGASGLRAESIHFFEDIVTAMMQLVKQRAEQSLGQDITHTVIGRPVNFQGLHAEKSNEQAIAILTKAAQRAGFKNVEFLFEPIAAGLRFEQSLQSDRTVLVVDVGGGTTDCAMVRMGPSHRIKADRTEDFIGHSGERVGGNDLDVQLAGQHFMPLFGMESTLKNGLHMPTKTFWDAVRTNDVSAQAEFNSKDTNQVLKQLLMDCVEPALLKRFIKLRQEKQNHHVVRSAEQTKIALSSTSSCLVDFSYIESELNKTVNREQFAHAVRRPVEKMAALMQDAIQQAGCHPDLVFVTGGSAQSPVIRQAIEDNLGMIEVLDGDHFGSVAAGLTVWANRIFA